MPGCTPAGRGLETPSTEIPTCTWLSSPARAAFSAGGDPAMVENAYRNPEEIGRILWTRPATRSTTFCAATSPSSAINGAAVGAGWWVALLADISIAAESARLADGHVRMGVAVETTRPLSGRCWWAWRRPSII